MSVRNPRKSLSFSQVSPILILRLRLPEHWNWTSAGVTDVANDPNRLSANGIRDLEELAPSYDEYYFPPAIVVQYLP
jgi:hypothetical protein